MGRWAYFDSGAEYKFAVATQSSDDIQEFGGRNYFYVDFDYWREQIIEDIPDEDVEDKQAEQEAYDAVWAACPNGPELTYEQYCELPHHDHIRGEWTQTWAGVTYDDVRAMIEDMISAEPHLYKVGLNLDEFIRSYPLTNEGTHDLWVKGCDEKLYAVNPVEPNTEAYTEAYHALPLSDREHMSRVMLGCHIAHQMLYTEGLSCTYDNE